MQPVSWYMQRLVTMSASEILWRVRSEARDGIDRVRYAVRFLPSANGMDVDGSFRDPGISLSAMETGRWAQPAAGSRIRGWADRLKRRADAIAADRVDLFNLSGCFLGDPIDWNRDHEGSIAAPMRFAPAIDYRDRRVAGDAKLVWEPNRHQHLVVLARAYRALGEDRYADAAARHLDSWLAACPFGYGMNWRSPLELAIRLINWVWTIDLLAGHCALGPDLRRRLLESVRLHVWEIARKFSRGSSANNHVIGEAAGVLVACAYFPRLPGAARLMEESRAILSREILRQTFGEGWTREQATGYQLFVLQFLLVAGVVAKKAGKDFDGGYWERLGRMLEVVAALSEGGPLPGFGDCDDGYVLDLAGGGNDPRELLAVGAVLYGRDDFKRGAKDACETAVWLLGEGDAARFDAVPTAAGRPLRSRIFEESGFCLLQCGPDDDERRISVTFDFGELGYTAIAAHGHADALSLTLRVGGRDILVDPGTYDYFTYPKWRAYFRTTAAHNTVEIDGKDQSRMLGPFLWGRRAESRCIAFEPKPWGGMAAGEHDGYARQGIPAVHRRSVALDEDRVITIRDEVLLGAPGVHRVRVSFHFGEECGVVLEDGGRAAIENAGIRLLLEMDPALSCAILRGSEDPPGGWVSRGYHRRAPAVSLVGTASVGESTTFVHRIRVVASNPGPVET